MGSDRRRSRNRSAQAARERPARYDRGIAIADTTVPSVAEHNDLFGGAVSESDEEDASQKGSHPSSSGRPFEHSLVAGMNERHHAPSSVDARIDLDGLFSGDLAELSNMDTSSQAHPIDDDRLDQVQWPSHDDLNLDDNTGADGLPEGVRIRLEECQNELYRLNNEKANIDNQLAQMNNPALRVRRRFVNIEF